ncbi:hypothetical protein AOXY_G24438 [Acipenser oxyrinchus oxyrinchus]|uniref:Protein FAM81A n=1 Tax=Acipenser oxyrinchus oxyrinchus TaxID=40147 RepID=A0AAD8CV65_ACIOX|nr:hypothetical protein AOXY_G24438 [Acipenser oxyrinchus oxyrinchus]
MSRRSTSFPSPASFERSSHRPRTSLRHTCSLPAVPVHPVAMVNRVDQLEDRVVSHEKTSPAIVKQALQEEIVNNLQGPQSKGVGEQDARQLLEEHIQTITAIVSRLNRDIEVLQEQIHARDGVSYGTNTALKSLEMQQLCSLGDLRWRIARCDASISRLSAEVKTTQESIQNLAKEQKSSKADVECKIKHIEIQISRVLGKIEQSVAQQEAKIKANREDSSHQLHLLEAKLEGVSEDLKGQLVSVQNSLEKEQERAVTECLTKIEQLSLVIKEQTDKNDKIVVERYGQLSMKLDKIEEVQKMNLGSHRVKHAEEKEKDRINKIEKEIWKEIQDMRAETNAGFAAIHESLGSLRHVLEAKMKLEKDQLQKQIHQVKKMTQSSAQENQQKLHM